MSLRQQLRDEALDVLREQAPELGAQAVERIINSSLIQGWFDRIERRRPRGIVAWVRRLRGKQRGITPEQRAQLEELVRRARR